MKKSPKITKESVIVALSLIGILAYLCCRFLLNLPIETANIPLLIALALGGIPIMLELLLQATRKEFGSDIIAGAAIFASTMLGEYLAGTLVVLMLSGGKTLENYAVQNATFALRALANRLPSVAHRRNNSKIEDISLEEIRIDDILCIYPHEISPTDGIVIEGDSVMDEAYLTGEPFKIAKAPGSTVLSGAVNGENLLVFRATRLAKDSRYTKIMEVMRSAELRRPKLRRLGDKLGAIYTPIVFLIAGLAWFITDDAIRFLSVLVVATPCPLLIGIPVAIIGSVSVAAKRGIIVRDPAIMEQINQCQTIILDKTGTLTYGEPSLTEVVVAENWQPDDILRLTASLEQYSKHPLASAIVAAAEKKHLAAQTVSSVSEPPGQGLVGTVEGRKITVTSRKHMEKSFPEFMSQLPPVASGLECVVLVDQHYAATLHFHDGPREDSEPFIGHLGDRHGFKKVMLLSGDRESEVKYLAAQVGIDHIHASKSPEEKVTIVRHEASLAPTLFVGDGINDAPALATAQAGIAMGRSNEVTVEAAGAVVMDNSLRKVDEFFHISAKMKRVALQSAVGGMALSIICTVFAAAGFLPPVAGAITQEIIDLLAIANSLRTSYPLKKFSDF